MSFVQGSSTLFSPSPSPACRKLSTARHRVPAAAAAAAAQQAAVQQLLTRRSYAPPRFVGHIQVERVPSKRYGLVAIENLPVGSLLLVVPPLVAAYGPAGAAPSNNELVHQLEGQYIDPWRLQWLRLLYRDPTTAAAANSASEYVDADAVATQQADQAQLQHNAGQALLQQQQQDGSRLSTDSSDDLAVLQQLLAQGDGASAAAAAATPSLLDTAHAAAAATAAAADQQGAVSMMQRVLCPFNAAQLQQVIAENAYAEQSEDLGAALLRELDPESVTGLWPEFALLNHSCTPNTVAVVVGQYLLLRAIAPVLKGEELTGSYLGRLGFSPVSVRRAYLHGVYGFHCQCERCMAEQASFPTVYYPADNAVLGIVDPNKPRAGANSSSKIGQETQQQGLTSRVLRFLGLQIHQQAPADNATAGQPGSQWQQQQQHQRQRQRQQQPPRPSKQHNLLLELHTEAELLTAAVQEAVAADTRRTEKQFALLQLITQKVDSLSEAVTEVVPRLQECTELPQQQLVRWLLAAAYMLLSLQVELLELLLASGELAVNEQQLVYAATTGIGSSSSSSGSDRYMAAAGAAATARLSRSPGSKGWFGFGKNTSNSADWLQNAGHVTKQQLLVLYVEALERCLLVVDAIARGTETHLTLSLKHMDAVRRLYGVNAKETKLAEGLCSRAHAARYGVMTGEQQRLVAALTSARRRRLLGASLAQKMSVLAWETSIARD